MAFLCLFVYLFIYIETLGGGVFWFGQKQLYTTLVFEFQIFSLRYWLTFLNEGTPVTATEVFNG